MNHFNTQIMEFYFTKREKEKERNLDDEEMFEHDLISETMQTI